MGRREREGGKMMGGREREGEENEEDFAIINLNDCLKN